MKITEEFRLLIDRWSRAKDQLDYYKAEESELRRKVAGQILDDVHEPTSQVAHGFGVTVVATYVVNTNINESVFHELDAKQWLTKVDLDCVDWKLKLVPKNLKKLPKTSKLWRAITSKPGMPKLDVKPS